jgi:hypothetical protein
MQLPSNELADIALRDPHGDAVPLIDARVAAAIANPLGQSPNGSPVTEGKGSIAGTGPRDSLARGNPCGVALPTATLRATTAAWHRVAAGDLQRWIGERWSWLRPRTVPIIVAFAAMLAMMDAVKRLTIYARGDDVVQLPAAHNCVAHRAASPREHTRPLLMIEGAGSVAGAPLAEQYPFRSPRD